MYVKDKKFILGIIYFIFFILNNNNDIYLYRYFQDMAGYRSATTFKRTCFYIFIFLLFLFYVCYIFGPEQHELWYFSFTKFRKLFMYEMYSFFCIYNLNKYKYLVSFPLIKSHFYLFGKNKIIFY